MKLKIHKHTVRILLVSVGVLVLGISLFSLLSWWETHRSVAASESSRFQNNETEVIYFKGMPYSLRRDLETVLLIGVDKYVADTDAESYNNTEQADFLMLLIVDHQNKTYSALQLNRDTMTEITMLGVRGEKAGSFTGQLALAHTYGDGGKDSCRNTVEAVSNLLYGIGIDHYVALTMDAVPIINDLSGGVQIEMLEDFSSIDPAMSKGNVVTLQGNQALIYVQTRKGLDDSTNLSRMVRQQQYLNALSVKIQDCVERDEDFMFSAATQISPYMESDYTIEQLSSLFEATETYQKLGIDTIEGEAVQGEKYIEYYADENDLRSFVIDHFYEPYVETEPS